MRQSQVESYTNINRQVHGLPIANRRRQVTRQGEGRIRNTCVVGAGDVVQVVILLIEDCDLAWLLVVAADIIIGLIVVSRVSSCVEVVAIDVKLDRHGRSGCREAIEDCIMCERVGTRVEFIKAKEKGLAIIFALPYRC